MEQFIKKTIRKAGDALMSHFGSVDLSERAKNGDTDINSVVTEADLESQEIIIRAIKDEYPDHGIVAEEEDYAEGYNVSKAPYVWFIDPLDGTLNFRSNVPLFGINIGVWDGSKVSHAAIYLPTTEELCYAEHDTGVELNGKSVTSSDHPTWERSYGIGQVGTKAFLSPNSNTALRAVAELSNGTAWFNSLATPAVTGVWIASGRRDWFISSGSKDWDYAAPSLIMSEAGCAVTTRSGDAWSPGAGNIVVTNGSIPHNKLLNTLQDLIPSKGGIT